MSVIDVGTRKQNLFHLLDYDVCIEIRFLKKSEKLLARAHVIIVICSKKYTFGHHLLFWVPVTEFLKALEFPVMRRIKDVFCYINEVTVGKHHRTEAGRQWSQP